MMSPDDLKNESARMLEAFQKRMAAHAAEDKADTDKLAGRLAALRQSAADSKAESEAMILKARANYAAQLEALKTLRREASPAGPSDIDAHRASLGLPPGGRAPIRGGFLEVGEFESAPAPGTSTASAGPVAAAAAPATRPFECLGDAKATSSASSGLEGKRI